MPDFLLLSTLTLLVMAVWPGQPNRAAWLVRLSLLFALSPLLRYVEAVFGFAVRLYLSRWAGGLLQAVGVPVQIEGNVLIVHAQEMAVDPACMGLRMTGLTLLMAVFWLLAYERRQIRSLPLGRVIAYGGVALGLTIVANLFRIILLVLFGLGPAHPLHEPVGLVCVLIYAWLPLWALARRWVGRYGVVEAAGSGNKLKQSVVLRSSLPLVLLACVGLAYMRPTKHRYPTTPRTGYVRQATLFDFVQYSRAGELVYVKPLPDWYSAEHNPAVCWKGQGYTLHRIREATIAGRPVYVGELKKGRQTLQTAWWFTNGSYRSISQVDVRTRMLCGEPGFALVNVTVADGRALPAAVKAWQ